MQGSYARGKLVGAIAGAAKKKHKLKERIELSLYRHEWYVLTF